MSFPIEIAPRDQHERHAYIVTLAERGLTHIERQVAGIIRTVCAVSNDEITVPFPSAGLYVVIPHDDAVIQRIIMSGLGYIVPGIPERALLHLVINVDQRRPAELHILDLDLALRIEIREPVVSRCPAVEHEKREIAAHFSDLQVFQEPEVKGIVRAAFIGVREFDVADGVFVRSVVGNITVFYVSISRPVRIDL